MKRLPFLFLVFLYTLSVKGQTPITINETKLGNHDQMEERFTLFVTPSTPVENLAKGFTWAEGPLWVPRLNGLLFTDVPNNKAYLWTEEDGLQLFLDPSGNTGYAISSQSKGANGLTLDAQGNLVLCQVGDRRVARLKNWTFTTPAFETFVDQYEGKLFNSPNDLVLSKKGILYFTDPPYGLKDQDQDALKELPFNGVFQFTPKEGIQLITSELTRPNGIALSRDEKTLYVANSDPKKAVIYAFDITENGVFNQRIFFDGNTLAQKDPGNFDGLKVHSSGVLFASGPGGILLIDANAKHLGTIRTNALTANCAFDTAEKYLYMTSHNQLKRIQLK